MSNPLASGRPGKSQFSFGRSRYAHPDSDFQSQRSLPWEVGEDEADQVRDYHASLRSDPTNSMEDLSKMLYVKGNPDIYGPDQPIVQENPVRPAGRYPQPIYRTGVDRQD
jgi:hypothetical protein